MLAQCATSLLKSSERYLMSLLAETKCSVLPCSHEVFFHKCLIIFYGRNKLSVILKATIQLNWNPTFWVVYVSISFSKYFENEKFIPFVSNRYLFTTVTLQRLFLYKDHCPMFEEVQLYLVAKTKILQVRLVFVLFQLSVFTN